MMADEDNIANVDEMDWEASEQGEKFASRRKKLAEATGAEKLGASLYEVPPGKTAWPHHYHLANEEALFIISGGGELRLGDDRVDIEEGDWVSLKPVEEHAHQLINDRDEPLTYLCVSTMEEPDVLMYPDSEKVGVLAGSPPGGEGERDYEGFHRLEHEVGYWDGESDEDEG